MAESESDDVFYAEEWELPTEAVLREVRPHIERLVRKRKYWINEAMDALDVKNREPSAPSALSALLAERDKERQRAEKAEAELHKIKTCDRWVCGGTGYASYNEDGDKTFCKCKKGLELELTERHRQLDDAWGELSQAQSERDDLLHFKAFYDKFMESTGHLGHQNGTNETSLYNTLRDIAEGDLLKLSESMQYPDIQFRMRKFFDCEVCGGTGTSFDEDGNECTCAECRGYGSTLCASLVTERDSAQAEVAELKEQLGETQYACDGAEDERDKALAEVVRLRDLLKAMPHLGEAHEGYVQAVNEALAEGNDYG